MNQQKVVIYESNNCPHCEALLSFIKALNISYELKNVSNNHMEKKELRQQGIYGTPVTFIDEEIFLGVPKKRIRQKLGFHSTPYFH